MPSRPTPIPIPSPPLEPLNHHHHHHRHHHIPLLPIVLPATLTLLVILFLTLLLLHRKLSRNRTTPSDDHQRRFSYTLLRRSASSFSSSTLLGHGGFGAVYKATLPSGQCLALKVMDSPGSLQGEREFHNELSIASALSSPHILSLHGFSSDRRRRKLVLVYEYMPNRSLQDALLDNKCVELMEWQKRFDIAIDIAKGLAYLHHFCDPPVIHGDVKPSNILLDADFKAKIGDFGLARLKTEDLVEKREVEGGEDNGSILEETESVTTGFDEGGAGVVADRSPESCVVRILDSEASPENMAVSPEVGIDKASASDGCFDKMSLDSGKDLIGNGRKNGGSRRDWWWKQDINGGGSESGRVKDYVMEWIGSEIKKERPKNEWIESPSSAENDGLGSKVELKQKQKQKKQRKRLDWWASLDEERMAKRKEKTRKPREWWKEEFCEELSKKTKKKKRTLGSTSDRELWWQKDDDDDEDVVRQERKKKRKNKNSRGSIDWWLDGLSGELRNGRRNSQDWTNGGGGDIPKSGGISSTPSMRGTVCYIAPEYGGGGLLSEKCDVYSFGVLLLVIVSGRRPLQVTASPMSEFERANLISWARQLARNGKLLDLVDSSIHSLEKEQALLCITIALLCLQKSPSKRPTTKDIVGMLTGEAEPPHLPFEFSPSPPSSFPFKSRKKAR